MLVKGSRKDQPFKPLNLHAGGARCPTAARSRPADEGEVDVPRDLPRDGLRGDVHQQVRRVELLELRYTPRLGAFGGATAVRARGARRNSSRRRPLPAAAAPGARRARHVLHQDARRHARRPEGRAWSACARHTRRRRRLARPDYVGARAAGVRRRSEDRRARTAADAHAAVSSRTPTRSRNSRRQNERRRSSFSRRSTSRSIGSSATRRSTPPTSPSSTRPQFAASETFDRRRRREETTASPCDATRADGPPVEGFIIDRNLSLSNLMGTISEFYRRLGPEFNDFKFKPTYNPYTEPSRVPLLPPGAQEVGRGAQLGRLPPRDAPPDGLRRGRRGDREASLERPRTMIKYGFKNIATSSATGRPQPRRTCRIVRWRRDRSA